MPTREEKNQSEKLQKIMEDEANKAVAEEIEKIKSEINRGRTKYNERKLKKRLEDVSKNAVNSVIADAESSSRSLGSAGMIKSGNYFYPVSPHPSLFVPFLPAAISLAKLAAIGIAALAAGEGMKELDEWYHSTYEVEFEAEGYITIPEEAFEVTNKDIEIIKEVAVDVCRNHIKELTDLLVADLERHSPKSIDEKLIEERAEQIILNKLASDWADEIIDQYKPPERKRDKLKKWIKQHPTAFTGYVVMASFITEELMQQHGMRLFLQSTTGQQYADAVTYTLVDADKSIKDNDYDSAKKYLESAKESIDDLENFINSWGDFRGVLKSTLRNSKNKYDILMDQVEKGSKVGSFAGNTISGKIVKVNDGDTLVMRTYDGRRVTIRVLDLECPEKGQDAYKYCNEIARALIEGKDATATISGTTGGWEGDRVLADVSFSGGDFATAMKRETGGECL